MATLTNCLIALNGIEGPEWYQAGDSLIKPCYVVMEDDADEVKICSTSGKPLGVAALDGDHDLNTIYTIGVSVPVYLIGSKISIYVLHDGTAADVLTKGISVNASSNTAGAVMLKPAWAAKTTTYNLAVHVERADTDHYVVGRSLITLTITSGTAAFIPIILK